MIVETWWETLHVLNTEPRPMIKACVMSKVDLTVKSSKADCDEN